MSAPPSVELTIGYGPVDSPSEGVRTRWPEGPSTRAQVDPDGNLSITGLTPTEYHVRTRAPGHAD